MTYAKLGRFSIFGIIQQGQQKWAGTKVHVREGLIKPSDMIVPAGLLGIFRDKADGVAAALNSISNPQREKIRQAVDENLEKLPRTDQFRSIIADAEMFGRDAVTEKE